jgi:TolB-like protein
MEDGHLRYLAPRGLPLVALLFFLGGADGMGQEVQPALPTVAVLDFTGLMIGEGANSAPLGKAVAAMLVTELSGREGMRVIERYHLQDLLTEQRLSLSGRVEEDTALEVGLMVGAQYTIYGQVTSLGETTRMDMRIVNVETSEVLEVEKLSDATSELLSMVVRMADMFTEKLNLEGPGAREEVTPIPVQATIAFSRGIDFEDKGETERAIEQYRRALEIHPTHRDAQKALDRLLGGGGDR